ncbi:MAG: hypothetical protein PHX27_02735 [Candidatus ainarchaeum sp.]|nr:hypothetical protein [Candidatus ainarchaeum sp.]
MKYGIDEHTNISRLPKDAHEIHLIRPIKKSKLDELITIRQIKKISLSESCYKRLPEKTLKNLKDSNIELSIEKKRGRALDISLETMLQIIELRKDYQSIREIERLTNTPKSTVHYLLKYAERGKIKKGSTIIYLK